ncbi:magnesium-transporting ATPase (P-type) [Metabacillus crassostreae]|uniref:hypothetical protein n=1 Tax=Metabacillus crassostreae TaxID=929098 RepID=UPI0019579A37|nr:hypothetical protein [Metabacillus crassostreae]MBM7603101.1 magnesium-transporting ATPase (P-type) [Metabacillus crassostreae]
MYDALQIGPFTIQYFLLIAVLTFWLTYFILDSFLKDSEVKQLLNKHYWTIVFILFLSYKFSIVILRPELLLSSSWIFLTGGEKGIYLGVLLAIIFLLWQVWRKRASIKTVIYICGLVIICYTILFQIIKIFVLSIL